MPGTHQRRTSREDRAGGGLGRVLGTGRVVTCVNPSGGRSQNRLDVFIDFLIEKSLIEYVPCLM